MGWRELAALRVRHADLVRRRLLIAKSVTEVNGRACSHAEDAQRRSVPFSRFLVEPPAARGWSRPLNNGGARSKTLHLFASVHATALLSSEATWPNDRRDQPHSAIRTPGSDEDDGH